MLAFSSSIAAEHPPVIPVGLDAYREWDRWPVQQIGVRAYMRSTYDRAGRNEGADASHFLYQLSEERNVTLDIEGPGVLYFARYNHWHGSPWHYEVDGGEHIVAETSTADPLRPAQNSVFLPTTAFPNPLTWTWSQTKGADLSWVPIPFERSFRMSYSRTHYGTGYYIYHQYVPGIRLSHRVKTWSENRHSDHDVLDLVSHAGSDLLPNAGSVQGRRLGLEEEHGRSSAAPSSSCEIFRTRKAPSTIRAIEFRAPFAQAIDFGRARLRAFWDDSPYASIDAPVALFFGAGTLYNRDGREYLVRAFPVSVRYESGSVHLACYFPMPFFRSAKIELLNRTGTPLSFDWSVRHQPCKDPASHLTWFHATYRDHPQPEPGKDLVLLDTRQAEGGGDWSGQLVGTSWTFSDRAILNTLEGDPRFFFDDSRTPQAQGTGTEEWGGGGDYWGGQNMTLPFAGHPAGAPNAKEAKCEEDKIESAYRFLLADLMPFGRNALIQLEHGGENESTEHYQTVTYWYGSPHPTLVQTDELKIGDDQSERAHQYHSPEASPPYVVTSRYEWGVDTLRGKEIFPAETDTGRKTTGTSEFNLKLDPSNFGVMLRRKLDYQFPNQRAEISVAEIRNGKPGKFKPAGAWYLAGGNTCVYSNPKEEVGPVQHIVQTSNRRFRDDEFLLPLDLTKGRSEIRIRVQFTPVRIPLYPGRSLPELAWSEIRYDCYCFRIPRDRGAF